MMTFVWAARDGLRAKFRGFPAFPFPQGARMPHRMARQAADRWLPVPRLFMRRPAPHLPEPVYAAEALTLR